MEKIKLSIVLPVFNEEKRLDNCFKKIQKFVNSQKFICEVIFVDDGSKDKSGQKIKNFIKDKKNFRLISLPKHKGKGKVVKIGVLAAAGEKILFSDADIPIFLYQVENFLKRADKYEVVVASRFSSSNKENHEKNSSLNKKNISRRTASKVLNSIVNFLFSFDLSDTQCGFKVFQNKAAKEIFRKSKISGFAFDIESLFLAKKLNFKISEIPVLWENNPKSTVRLFQDSLKVALDLVRIKLWDFIGRY